MSNGYFLVSRGLVAPDHDLHPHRTGDKACRLGAWIDMIGMARWKDGGGLKRGQFAHSERFLAVRWNRDRSWVRRFLDHLEAEGRITRDPQKARQPARITICNYETYQSSQPTNTTTNDPPTGPRTGPRTGPKKKEEEQEENKPPIVPLWDVWVDEVWGGDTKRRLTSKRRKKLRLVWDEHLEGHDDPVGFFRKMVQAILADDWWGPKPSTHLPEKAMRNEERREEWAVAARNGKTQPSDADRRKKHGGISYVSREDMA